MAAQAQIVLSLNLDETAFEGAGWYIYASMDGGNVIPAKRIAEPVATSLAQAFDNALRGLLGDNISTTQIVVSGNKRVRAALERQLEFAMAQAQRVTHLQQLLASMQTQPTGEQ